MLLAVPTKILLGILAVIVIAASVIIMLFMAFRTKQAEDVNNEPEDIKKKSDAPELPSEGQENKPIDKVDEAL